MKYPYLTLLLLAGCVTTPALVKQPQADLSPQHAIAKAALVSSSEEHIAPQSVLPPPPSPSFSLQYGLQWPTMADPDNQSVVVVIMTGDVNIPLAQWTVYGMTNAQTFSYPGTFSQPSQQFMLYTSNTVSHGVSAWATK